MRKNEIARKTKETNIKVKLNIDGTGKANIKTGIGFFDHMLELFTFHGGFDLDIDCNGDTNIDCHHTVEDTGISLGTAFKKALGVNPGINRYGLFYVPMDEALSRCVVDICGRSNLVWNVQLLSPLLGNFETETVREFFKGFADNSDSTIHIETLYGDNTHHIIESIFKSFGRAFSIAFQKNSNGIPSTKGLL